MSKYSSDLENNVPVIHGTKRLLTPFLSKKIPPIPRDEDRKYIPILTRNIFSRVFLTWLVPMLNVGYKRTLTQNDLWKLNDSLKLETAFNKFENELDKILQNHRLKHPDSTEYPKFAVVSAILKSMKWEYSLALLLKSLGNAANAFVPYVMKYLINAVEMKATFPSTPVNKGVGFAFAISLLLIFYGILRNQALMLSKLVGAQSRTILTKALLKKSLTASSETNSKFNKAHVISMMGADLERIDEAFGALPDTLTAPIPIIIGIVILIVNLKVSALAGIAVFFVILVLMSFPMGLLLKYRKSADLYTDKRVSVIREVLLNLKMIKFYSWEDAYEKLIGDARSKENNFVLKFQVVVCYMAALIIGSSGVTSMVSFLVLYAISNINDAAVIFSSLSLFTMLCGQIIEVPSSLSFVTQGYTGITRITKYLQASNKTEEVFYDELDDESLAFQITDGSFQWDVYEEEKSGSDDENENDEKDERTEKNKKKKLTDEKKESKDDKNKEVNYIHKSVELFKDLNFSVKKGEFVIILGSTGSGKSSLLSALSNQMTKTSGSVAKNGSLIFCSSPWIQSTSIRENILFGEDYDSLRYKNVIEACCLSVDLESLAHGDSTQIGERGVTLSGGQRARVDLARAAYNDFDIYLFDDVLSAVDMNVGKVIFDDCFNGVLKNKTKILATNQLGLVDKVDRIIFLNKAGNVDVGTKSELMKNEEFVKLLEYHNAGKDVKVKKDEFTQDLSAEANDLYQDEERAYNSIPLSLYFDYIKSGKGIFGNLGVPLIIFFVALNVFAALFSNVWLSFWISHKFDLSNGVYIGLYILFTFLTMVFALIQFGISSYMTLKASKSLSLMAIEKILHTPMSFMDTTPIGRILNRFTKDINALDNEVGNLLRMTIYFLGAIIGILILAIIYIPWFAIAVPFLVVVFVVVTNYYQASSREVKRLEAINKSFVLNNFNEVLGGLDTINRFSSESRFLEKNNLFSDHLNEVYFIVNANQRWIGVTLDTISGLLVLITSLLTVTRTFNINASSAGLLTTYMIDFANLLASIVEFYSELENEMNSVERVYHYAKNLDQEKPYLISETCPPPEWPLDGNVQFKNVSLRYREELPLILKNLTFDVKGGSKIGIVGRTGAGKSSIMVGLYRIAELSEGQIIIDGIDISKLGLHQLRSKLSIIPQDPVLFKGNIRLNLDPFNEYHDDELWDSLRRSGLVQQEELPSVKEQKEDYYKFHLLNKVEEEGSNFSMGERQLISLARALVRNSKILIMDEATSNVDYETDAKIQKTISKEFRNSTVLCIAHRLRTVIHHDKILVLDKGSLVEYNEPSQLYRANGVFTQMCEAAGIHKEELD